ncbi:hypothetical protein B0H15DRAFT_149346 [Mycena belliarum]|uniref:Protein-S-isoprenylcysteine O-methyltransferase n=1 Tax=Mycena belliarum TaxID=1033014 RepID=A0AAD6UE09_9AGAR|nr:hypothetical protein B0H15DRAFT_149346 [Mycena belliae]
MPLTRILCIVTSTLGLHTVSTSPNPPLPDSGLAIAPTSLEFMLASRYLRTIQTCFYWSVGAAETVVIVARIMAPSPWAQDMLSTFSFGGDLTRVHLTATPTVALGSLLIASGAIVRLHCYKALGVHFTFETGILQDHKLVTTGPYGIVRHPGYTGAFLAYVGLMLYYGSPGSWAMECVIKGSSAGRAFGALYAVLMFLVVTGLTWRISKEDAGLRNEFGQEWERYAAEVRYVLIPGVF